MIPEYEDDDWESEFEDYIVVVGDYVPDPEVPDEPEMEVPLEEPTDSEPDELNFQDPDVYL